MVADFERNIYAEKHGYRLNPGELFPGSVNNMLQQHLACIFHQIQHNLEPLFAAIIRVGHFLAGFPVCAVLQQQTEFVQVIRRAVALHVA